MFKKSVSMFMSFFLFLTAFLMLSSTTVLAEMPTIIKTVPEISSDFSSPTKNIPVNTDIQIKFSKNMDNSLLKLTGNNYISLLELKTDNSFTKKSMIPSDFEKSYDSETFTLTIKTSKYLEKNSTYLLKVKQNFLKSADGEYMPLGDQYYYFTTEADSTAKVGGIYFSRETGSYAGEPIVPILNDGTTPGAQKKYGDFLNRMYIYFSDEIDYTTITKSSVLLKDKNGDLVSDYSMYEDSQRLPGRRFILSTTKIMDSSLNPYSLYFTEDIKTTDGTNLDVTSNQLHTPVTLDDGKKAVKFTFNYDTSSYAVDTASISLNDDTSGNLMGTTEDAPLEDSKTTGEINVVFNENIDAMKIKTKGSFVVPPTLAIYKGTTKISTSLFSYTYNENENKLNIKYNTLDPNQVYKLKLTKTITDFVGNKPAEDFEVYFKTADSQKAPELFKIYYKMSSLGEKKYVTDLNQDISTIRTKTSSLGTVKLYFDMNVTSIDENSNINNDAHIRILNKDMTTAEGFSTEYSSDDCSFTICVDGTKITEGQNPYYIALTENIKAETNSKPFSPEAIFGGQVTTLDDGKKALLLPFNMDGQAPAYAVRADGTLELSGELNAIELTTNSVINIYFNERMNTTGTLYGIGYDAKNIVLAVKNDTTGEYEDLDLLEEEYEITPTSLTLKPDWSKYGLDKIYRLNVKEFKVMDEAGWPVTPYTFAYSWFKIPDGSGVVRDSTLSPTYFEVNKDKLKDITVTMNLKGNTLENIKNENSNLTIGSDYTVEYNVVTIKKEFLQTLKNGTKKLIFDFNQGKDAELTLDVTGVGTPQQDSSLSPVYFDIYKDNLKDIETTMNLNGNTLVNIKKGNSTLTEGPDYSVENSVVTIKKEYLETLENGTRKLIFHFSQGKDCQLTLAVAETKPASDNKLLFKVIDMPESFNLGGDAKLTLQVTNNTDEIKTVTLIMGLFDNNNTFKNYVAVKQEISKGSNVSLNGMMMLPNTGDFKVKCFIWDTLDEQTPLSPVMEIPVK